MQHRDGRSTSGEQPPGTRRTSSLQGPHRQRNLERSAQHHHRHVSLPAQTRLRRRLQPRHAPAILPAAACTHPPTASVAAALGAGGNSVPTAAAQAGCYFTEGDGRQGKPRVFCRGIDGGRPARGWPGRMAAYRYPVTGNSIQASQFPPGGTQCPRNPGNTLLPQIKSMPATLKSLAWLGCGFLPCHTLHHGRLRA
jgi:hypothetical protein